MSKLYCTSCGEGLYCGECGQVAREGDFEVKTIEQDSALTYLSIGLKWLIRAFVMLLVYIGVIIASILIIFPVWWIIGLCVYAISWAFDKEDYMRAWKSSITLTWFRDNLLRHEHYRKCRKSDKLKYDCNSDQGDHYGRCSDPESDYVLGMVLGGAINTMIIAFVLQWLYIINYA